jgi:pilus assembly protein CpaB
MAGNWVRQSSETREVPMATVIAADIAVPFGTKVSERHLKTLTMPAEFVPPGSFSSIEDVLGRVTVQPVVAGEILMRERFSEFGDGSTLAALVSEKMRAVTVRVDDVIGVAGFLLPGNRVDVLAARLDTGRRATAETILRDVKVLAVDQTAATEKNEPVIVRAVTLEVNPAQAEVLVKAKEEGSIQLTLRNPLDDELFVEAAPAPAPIVRRAAAPAAPRQRTVTVIRGTDVSTAKEQS